MTTQLDEILRHLRAIISANHEFRSSLPEDWESDPVNDACEEAEKYLLYLALERALPHLFALNHPAGPAWAIFRQEKFVGWSFGESAESALDLWITTPLSNGVMPGRLAGPWSAVIEPEARQRGMIRVQTP